MDTVNHRASRRSFLAALGVGVAGIAVSGCSSTGHAPVTPFASATGAVYPPPPALPRVRHLATYATERDVVPRKRDFARFIAGDATTEFRLARPYGAAMYDGRLLVVDTGGSSIAEFDIARSRFRTILARGDGRLSKPINITIDRDGTRYVCDTGRNQVVVFDRNHEFLRAIGDGNTYKPVDCVVTGDVLYVTDVDHHQVLIVDKQSGRIARSFGRPGSGPGELFHPTNIAIGPDGDLYVAETGNFRVQRFSPEGIAIRSYGHAGDSPGSFARPKGIAIDRDGRLFVGDSAFENVQVFDNAGQLLMHFGSTDNPYERLNLPTSVVIDYDNIGLFQASVAPDFSIDFLIIVVSQFGPNKVDVFGFGKQDGVDYPDTDTWSASRTAAERIEAPREFGRGRRHGRGWARA